MSGAITAVAVGTVAKGYMDKKNAEHAAKQASKFQIAGQESAIDEYRSSFDNFTKLLSPYISAGSDALGQQRDILGLSGPDAQKAVIDMLQASPAYSSQLDLGENRIKQNAAATGGLRGGDIQAALAQFGPSILTSLINQQFSRLGGLSSAGQAGATNLGNADMDKASGIGAAYTGIGQANAGREIAQGQANTDYFDALARAYGSAVGGIPGSPAGGVSGRTATYTLPAASGSVQGAFDANGNYVPQDFATDSFNRYGLNLPGGGF